MYLSTVPISASEVASYVLLSTISGNLQNSKGIFNYIFKKLNFLLASIHKIYGPFAFLYPA